MIIPNGTRVCVTTDQGQIYYGIVVDSSIISGSEDYEYQVEIEGGSGVTDWYPAKFVSVAQS